jgi:hypothetical protein
MGTLLATARSSGPFAFKDHGAFPPSKPTKTNPMSDSRFNVVLLAVLCPLTFAAVMLFPMFGSLTIMLVPIAYAIRAQQRGR